MKLTSHSKRAWLSGLAGLILGADVPKCDGATVVVTGFLEGDALLGPDDGDTLDYYVFEVLSSGRVRIESIQSPAYRFLLAEHIGREDEFGFLGDPFFLRFPCVTTGCMADGSVMWIERILDPGVYVISVGIPVNTSYDIFDGFVPVNREGGGFTQAPYEYSIVGDVRGLEYWDGHLDGTFTITRIPEPGAGWLVLAGLGGLWRRRRARRGSIL